MNKVKDLFDIAYGTSLSLTDLELDEKGVNFISRTSENNGVSARVKRLKDVEPMPKNTISVAVSGSVMESFLQDEYYYTGFHVLCLSPKQQMSKQELLFYCMCLRANKYKYNYGRQANRTLPEIKIPSFDKIPSWVNKTQIIDAPSSDSVLSVAMALHDREWKLFKYSDVFTLKKGFYNKKPDEDSTGNVIFIGASRNNNGITSKHQKDDIDKIYNGNCITIANDGNSVTSAFYQQTEFTCSHSVNILTLKDYKLNVYIAMFLNTIIKQERYRFNYGRKWRIERMKESMIKLPVNQQGTPDWQFMEEYIKSLPYSKGL